MTAEEKAFNDALDANPEDHTTRLVYADWLDEHGDPRAAGYRALAVNGREPCGVGRRVELPPYWSSSEVGGSREKTWQLPQDWFRWLQVKGKSHGYAPLMSNCTDGKCPSRRELEDAAALAFSRLPPERQAELLTPAVPVSS